ncbi:alpha-L-fucosidase, partial [Klebsiella pneumoniae]|uniref:alpha-L-fucosidase n=1 Tax=Klebsiella pneumoniae TaxID=573 RepID=UPI00272F9CD9
HGLRAGLYFSPRDWQYPGYPLEDVAFDHNKRGQHPPVADPDQNRRNFEAFYAYTIGQLHELLSSYGQLDLLWFDGMGWHGID